MYIYTYIYIMYTSSQNKKKYDMAPYLGWPHKKSYRISLWPSPAVQPRHRRSSRIISSTSQRATSQLTCHRNTPKKNAEETGLTDMNINIINTYLNLCLEHQFKSHVWVNFINTFVFKMIQNPIGTGALQAFVSSPWRHLIVEDGGWPLRGFRELTQVVLAPLPRKDSRTRMTWWNLNGFL